MTALELASVDLWGTQLVVLSACQTGLGDVRHGQGVHGLRRALVQAGAQSQLISLWQVDDDATQRLMGEVYARLAEGRGRAAALRGAQLKMLGEGPYQHPYYWAGFVLVGQWGPLRGLELSP